MLHSNTDQVQILQSVVERDANHCGVLVSKGERLTAPKMVSEYNHEFPPSLKLKPDQEWLRVANSW